MHGALLGATLAGLSLATGLAPAQAPYAVGVRDVAWSNPTGRGSATLAARVSYPAASAGRDVPVLARAGGWPVVVFLHGFAVQGRSYSALADALATAGYVVVANDTAQFASGTQALDGAAYLPALRNVNVAPGGPFQGALDVARVGLAGHSMGGGNTGSALAAEPGYRCGFCFAPVTPTAAELQAIRVPVGILVGTGDVIAPWQTWSEPYYAGLSAFTGTKSLTLWNGDATHTNVVGLFVTGGTGQQVFERAVTTALGFFDRWLRDGSTGLEDVLGLAARAEPRLVELRIAVEAPQVFGSTGPRLGVTSRVSVVAEPGRALALAAARFAPQPLSTPVGLLALETATLFVAFDGAAGVERRFDAPLPVPLDPALAGVEIPLQALGASLAEPVLLGGTARLTVAP
ncbi:MAG: hypothetical protein IPM29_17660 [Planctomycetes bacterium]|nr:hypothetical protein [Planctomycetota bacterium]